MAVVYDLRPGSRPMDTDKAKLKKDGSIAYERTGGRWDYDKLIDEHIQLHIGTGILKDRYKDEKWYMTVIINGISITDLADKLRYNKRISKTAIQTAVEKVKQVIKEKLTNFKNFVIKHQLCLPAPKDTIDLIAEQMDRLSMEHNNNIHKKKDMWHRYSEDFKLDTQRKLFFIFDIAMKSDILRKVYTQLIHAYHPDITSDENSIQADEIIKFYKMFLSINKM